MKERDAGKLPKEVRAWGAVSLFSDLSHEGVTSLLPAFLVSIGASPIALGVIEGASDALSAVAKLWGGRIADRARRLKRVTLLGYLLTTLSIPAIALAGSWPFVAVLRTVGWIGRGFRSPLRDTLLVRTVHPGARGRAFGLERALDQTGAAIAPIAVFLLISLSLDLRLIIALSVLPGLVAVTFLGAFVREHPRPHAREAPGSGPPRQPLGAPMKRFLAAIAVFGCGDFAKTLLVLWALGAAAGSIDPTIIGASVILYGWFNLVTVGAAWVGGRLSDLVGRRPVLVVSYLVGAAGAAVPVLAAPGWVGGAVALGLSGVLVGAEESVERAWAADLAGGRHGRAFGLLHTINGVGDLVASFGVGLLWVWKGPALAFGAAAALMTVGALLTMTIRTDRRSQAEH